MGSTIKKMENVTHLCSVCVSLRQLVDLHHSDKLTVFISGLAVTTCFSAGRNLFCLNSMSPTMN